MLLDAAKAIAKADREGTIEQARTQTTEVTHLRLHGWRYSFCGKRTARIGAGTRDCRTCTRMLAQARQAE